MMNVMLCVNYLAIVIKSKGLKMNKKMIFFILLISNIFLGCGNNNGNQKDNEVIKSDPLIKLLNQEEQRIHNEKNNK